MTDTIDSGAAPDPSAPGPAVPDSSAPDPSAPDPSASDPSASRRLDGNAAAGTLADLFAVDLTEARSRCASCGTTSMLGAHHLYADAPALVVRCPGCTAVVLRYSVQPGRILLDLRGTQLLAVPVPAADATP